MNKRERMFNKLQTEWTKECMEMLGIMLVYPPSEWESRAKTQFLRDWFRRRRIINENFENVWAD